MRCTTRRLTRDIVIWVVIGILAFILTHKAHGAIWDNLVDVGFKLASQANSTPKQPRPAFSEVDRLIESLAVCESGGNNIAVNPNDLDNTPSYSTFQWKPSTWSLYVKRYKLWNSEEWDEADLVNAMWDTQYQKEIVKKMFTDPRVDLRREFPGCSKKLGLKKNYGTS